MNFNTLKNAYGDLENLLKKHKNCPAALSDQDMDILCKAMKKIIEINDHSAVIYVYETLQKYTALPRTIGPRTGELFLYVLWLKARLRFVDYATGSHLLGLALKQFPNHAPLQELHVFYLWFYDTDQLDSWIHSQPLPWPVPESLLTVYAEHLIRQGQHDQAHALAFLANVDPRRRHDLALLMVNAAEDPAQKLLWFNQFLTAQNMATLSFQNPEQGFVIDNFSGTPRARHWSGDQPLVSVITTAYNCADFLETSAQSILNQSYRNLELMIVDDCSDHATREKIRALAARDPRVVPIFRTENGGTYIAKSEAMTRAKGQFVIFHDADDWAHPDKLWQEVSALSAEPELACWSSGWARINQHGQFVMQLSGKYAHPNPAGTLLRHPMVFDRLGGFDPVRTGADSAYKRRIQLEFGARSLRTDPTVLVLGRHHSGSLTQTGATSMGNFGWSPTRALYRGNWIDAMIKGGGHWAPLGMRKTPIKIAYHAKDVTLFDPLRRLGQHQQFDDILLIFQSRMSDRQLTQMHRLAVGLHETGYRVGIYFEEPDAVKDTWQMRDFQNMNPIHCYGDLGHIRAKICLLVTADNTGTHMRVLSRDLLDVAGRSHARALPRKPEARAQSLFMLSSGLNRHLPPLRAIAPEEILVMATGNRAGITPLKGNPFGFATVKDETGNHHNTLLLTGANGNDEDQFEMVMLARLLGRKVLHTPADFGEIEGISNNILTVNLHNVTELTSSKGTTVVTAAEYVKAFARDLSDHLAKDPVLNLLVTLDLPASGL